ncbi:hypothetical protein LUZ60_003279 [Juncus effusus]|nr:hypothetical protein LUZ60_003279 [Juncus effusus]
MAENAVILALAKVVNAFEGEDIKYGIFSLFNIILVFTSLPSCIKSIENELLVMKGFFSQIDLRRYNDEAFNVWLGQVRKLAYIIEDTIDDMFPEDCIMKRSRLVRLWIGEGFIEEERGLSNLEEIAEGYLTELVRRSLLQLVEKNSFGRVRLCKMHDIVRELAISLSKKESFHEIYDENNGIQSRGEFEFSYTRRLSVINSINGIESKDSNMPHVRSFIAFSISDIPSPFLLHFIFSKSRFLTVLDLQDLPIEVIPESIGDLFNLKCLHLRHTNVKSLPETISNLRNLQSLDLTATKVQNLEIFSRNKDEILQLENLNPLPPNLRKLHINGKLEEGTLDSPSFLDGAKDLKVFDLRWSQLDQNPFLSLSRLSWLTTIRLFRVYNGKNICFRAGWFPNLKILVMKDFLNVEKVVFEEGTLMNLARLRFEGFKELKDLPNGIEFLKSLDLLVLSELHAKFRSRWKKIDVLEILPQISILQIE